MYDVSEAEEGQRSDKKSLRLVEGRSADLNELANTCVAFANADGDSVLVGVEDDATVPPPSQRIDPSLPDRVRKRMGELTRNLQLEVSIATSSNGGEVLVLTVPRGHGVASTSDGRYFIRVGDQCQPVVGDEVLRLATDRPQFPWESSTGLQVPRATAEPESVMRVLTRLRSSERVKLSVREKSDEELLVHYGLKSEAWLTNLGVLLVGTPRDRMRLGTAPIVQAIRYDERDVKIGKDVWDDHALSPIELVDSVWATVPDFREEYEVSEGMFRASVPAYEEIVIRELLVNALVHRPYTQRGDIFLNLYPDRLEVVNPGRLPLGVTPANILHTSRRRNDGLVRVFHDLGLMEREGSGFDTMYDRLLATGRATPRAFEGHDSVRVVVPRRIVHAGVLQLIGVADERHHLTQRERITLGLLAQGEAMTSHELANLLGLAELSDLRAWLGRLVELDLVRTVGRTKGTRYFVRPELLRRSGLDQRITLQRLEPHRLRALIVEDVQRYPLSSMREIQRRIGAEIADRSLSDALGLLVKQGVLSMDGGRRWARYTKAAP